jgi:hypothetical protein
MTSTRNTRVTLHIVWNWCLRYPDQEYRSIQREMAAEWLRLADAIEAAGFRERWSILIRLTLTVLDKFGQFGGENHGTSEK